MENKNQFRQEYAFYVSQRRAEKLAQKFKIKSFAESYKPAYWVALFSSGAAHTASIATASFFVCHHIYTATSSIAAAIAATIVILLGWEAFKNFSLRKWFLDFFNEGIVHKLLGVSCIVAIGVSVALSYMGAPILSKYTAQSPELIDIQQLKDKQSVVMDSVNMHWKGIIDSSAAQANRSRVANTIKTGKSKGQIVWGMNENVAKLENATIKHREDHKVAIASLVSIHQDEIKEAKQENKSRVDKSQESQAYSGEIMASLTLSFELVMLLSLAFIQYYDHRESIEIQKGLLGVNGSSGSSSSNAGSSGNAGSASSKRRTGKKGTRSSSSGKNKITVVQGFNKNNGSNSNSQNGALEEGDLDMDNRLIYYKSKNGDKWLRKCDLTRYKASAGSEQQAQRIDGLLDIYKQAFPESFKD